MNIYLTEEQQRVLPRLLERLGDEKAGLPVKGKVLAEAFSITEGTVRLLVNALRSSGMFICATNDGYWLSRDQQEVERQIDALTGRIRGIASAIAGMKDAYHREWPANLNHELFDDGKYPDKAGESKCDLTTRKEVVGKQSTAFDMF